MTLQIDASTKVFRITDDEEEEEVKEVSQWSRNGFKTPPKEKEQIIEDDNLMIEEEKFMPITQKV